MYATIVKKFTGLLAVYAVVIVGIFVVQFKWPVHTFAAKREVPQKIAEQDVPKKEVPPPFAYSAFEAGGGLNGFSLASKEAYSKTVLNIENALVSSFKTALSSEASITEAEAVAFVAAAGGNGKLDQAIASVPPQIKRATYRTYLSAPYFGSLTSTYRSLEAALSNCRNALSSVKEDGAKAIGALGTERMADYILLNPAASEVVSALKAVSQAESFSVPDAATVLLTYSDLRTREKVETGEGTLSSLLESTVQKCFDTIEKCIITDKDTIKIDGAENPMQAARVGTALIKAGEAAGNEGAAACGRAIVNAYINSPESLSLDELSVLEATLVAPPHYPHLVLLGGGTYAFTCADSVKRTSNGEAIDIRTDTAGLVTHYMIICGVKPFSAIYIYGIPFHTDQKFETYNSSGFVYVANANALLLKNRQKETKEIIRLVYSAPQGETATNTAGAALGVASAQGE